MLGFKEMMISQQRHRFSGCLLFGHSLLVKVTRSSRRRPTTSAGNVHAQPWATTSCLATDSVKLRCRAKEAYLPLSLQPVAKNKSPVRSSTCKDGKKMKGRFNPPPSIHLSLYFSSFTLFFVPSSHNEMTYFIFSASYWSIRITLLNCGRWKKNRINLLLTKQSINIYIKNAITIS